MNEGKNSLDESIALITAANEVVNDPSSVGTALKTLTLRLRGSKTELEEMGEDVTDMATTTSQLQAKLLALTGGKVDIMLDANTFKNTTQILREMADAWDNMNDIQRASALELMGGKRQANTLSALIQNFETVEKAIEASANSAGSALKENERYLDSIQGKIDQFTNALQTMWINALDSDLVKDIVEIGTELIRLIDKIGLLPSVLGGVFIYFTAFKKNNPIEIIKDIGTSLVNAGIQADKYGTSLSSLTLQQQAAKMATSGLTKQEIAAQLVRRGGIEQSKAEALAEEALTAAKIKQSGVTAQQVLSAWAENQVSISAQAADWLEKQSTEALTRAKLLEAVASGAITKQDYLEIAAKYGLLSATESLKLGVQGLSATIQASMASNPVGWILMAISAIVMIVHWVSTWKSKTEELTEELNELKTELQDIQSEIKDVNSELETTNGRMAELLAKDTLSFTEKEELDRLKKQNDELQRELDLLERKEQLKQEEAARKFNETMESAKNDQYYITGQKKERWNYIVDGIAESISPGSSGATTNLETILKGEIKSYEKYYAERASIEAQMAKAGSKEEFDRLSEEKKKIDDEMYEIETYIQGHIDEFNSRAEGLDYFVGDDLEDWQIQSNEYLDYVRNWEDKLAIVRGDADAKTNALNRIFNKDEFDDVSDEIDTLLEKLKKTPDDKTIIEDIREQCELAADDILAVGLSVDDAVEHFTGVSSGFNSNTIDGITKQYAKGIEVLTKYKDAKEKADAVVGTYEHDDGTIEQITWGSLFNKETGEVVNTQLSKALQGADDTVREEFARIAKAVNEGKMEVDDAMASFSSSGMVSVSKLMEESFGELNKSVFKGLEDDISGFIDTFGEFSAALEDVASSMDLLHTAQEQYNNSGQVSVKTALELMQSTDQWNKILTVENGKITLNAEAQDILVQSKLNTVKANLAEAKASIQNQLAQLGAADATLLSAEASDVTTEAYTIYTNAMNSYSASIAGFGAALGALIEGRWGDIIGDFQGAYNATKEVKTYENNTSITALREKLAEVNQIEDFFEGVDTFDEFANNYDFDENPGDKYGNDEDSKTKEKMDAFQKEMDYWENRIAANQAKYEQLQNEIDLLETKGQKADTSFYKEQMKLEGERLTLLNGQKAAAEAHLKTLTEGSEEWWEVANTLNDIEADIDDVTASIVDLQDAIGEIDAYKFEEFNTRLDDLVSKLETIGELIAPNGEEDWFDEEGGWTEAGVAVLGKTIQELELYKQGLEETKDELKKYKDAYSDNTKAYYESLGIHSEQEYYDKVQELTEQQYDYAQSISDTEQSVVDMYESNIDAVEEYYDTLIDGYNDYIDGVKEALDAERDLYDFKKNVQKQTKDIAELERRIASLSGSTNAADIAERRKLEAQLYESRESLDDTYYDHAQSAQDAALDAEAQAYEETMTKVIEDLRISLEAATMNMDEFLMGVTSMVMYNADTVLAKYQETNLPLTDELTNPWIKAKEAVGTYSGDALDLMNRWTEESGFFAQFNATGTKNLQSPWSAGSTAASAFKTSVSAVMEGVVSNISTNVKTASGELSKLYQQIITTEKRATEAKVVVDNNNNNNNNQNYNNAPEPTPKPIVKLRGLMKTSREMILGSKSFVDANTEIINGVKYYRDSETGYYYKISDLNSKRKYDGGRTTGWSIPKGTWFYTKHAKGTTGTTRDEWAITDEPWLGDELVLVPTESGNLSYMRKGTGVVPADLTANLMEWGQFTPDAMNLGGGVNVNMINNAVNKPEFNFAFDALVKAENITEETLPAVKKLVTQELNRFTRELNYALKGKGAR